MNFGITIPRPGQIWLHAINGFYYHNGSDKHCVLHVSYHRLDGKHGLLATYALAANTGISVQFPSHRRWWTNPSDLLCIEPQ